MIKRDKGKRAVSTMVSYVIIVVIALGMAAGVYSWLKIYATIPEDASPCPENVVLTIKSYECDKDELTLTLRLENKGLFPVNGFFLMASLDPDELPTLNLKPADLPAGQVVIEGRYDFIPPLEPTETKTTKFSYSNFLSFNSPDSIRRISLQPYIREENLIQTCPNKINLELPEGVC
jgi:hypothetical protein